MSKSRESSVESRVGMLYRPTSFSMLLTRLSTLDSFLLLALTTLAYLLMLDPAFAAPAAGAAAGNFSCSGGHASGALYDSGTVCPTTMQMGNIFTFLVCNMERLAGNLLGEMYCGVMEGLIPAVMAMLTLATVFFGIGFTIGVIPATARDFQMFLLKMVFIMVFATQADVMIGTSYNLLVTGLREGTAIGISAMFTDNSTYVTGQDVYGYLDRFLAQTMHFATDYIGAGETTGANPCENAVFAVLAIMAVAFPPVFFIGVMIIFRVAITFLRAIFGYLYSITGIVFLLCMSPFFLSFYLFKITRPFFDKWLGYLVSFSLQMVILFAFLGFILSIDVRHVSGSLTKIIMPVEENLESTSMRMPWEYCTICDFKVVDKDGKEYPGDQYGAGDVITDGTLKCKDDPPKPIGVLAMTAPPNEKSAHDLVQGALIKFAAFGLLSLLVLAYVIEYLLNYVGGLARFLAGGLGANYAPILGGGEGWGQTASMDIPGGQLVDTFESGFTKGFTADMTKTSVVSTAAGFAEGAKWLVGGGPRNPETGVTNDPGMTDTFMNFILNPHRDPSNHG